MVWSTGRSSAGCGWKPATLWRALIGCSGLLLAAPALAIAETPIRFNIPAQPLPAALKDFAAQANVQLLYQHRVVRNGTGNSLVGEFDRREGLRVLLRGTGLEPVYSSETVVTIRPARAEASAALPGVGDSAGVAAPAKASGWLRLAQSGAPPARASAAVAAAPGDQPVPADQSSFVELGEIIVTASKRAERLQDVPASITALTSDTLAQIGAVRFEDYVARVPSLSVDNISAGGARNQLTIRGVSTGIGGNPTVGYYIDEAPFGSSTVLNGGAVLAPDIDPSDLQRIEVLRGPQGTLYGAGSMGGLIKFVTASPDPSGFSARLRVDGSSIEDAATGYSARAMVNVPITDALALRASGFTREDPGFIDDAVSGATDVNTTRVTGGRAALGWRPNDQWTAQLSAMIDNWKSDGSPTFDTSTQTQGFQPLYGDLEQVRAFGTDTSDFTSKLYDLRIEGEMRGVELVSATSYSTRTTDVFGPDGTPNIGPLLARLFGVSNAGGAAQVDGELDKFAQELRLSSSAEQRLAWQTGVFYTRERNRSTVSTRAFNALTGAPLPIAVPPLTEASARSEFDELAIFGNVTLQITPRFDITAGLRYSENEQRSIQVNLAGLLTGPASSADVSSQDSAVTYLLTPRLRLNDDWMIYVRVASGYRPGGPNQLIATGAAPTYDADTLVNYEAGVKAVLLDDRLNVDLAVFHIDWSDIQLRFTTSTGFQFFDNGGEARSRGAEAAVAWRPVRGLQIGGNISYLDAELTEDLPPRPFFGLKGDALPTTPNWGGQLSIDYQRPLAGDWQALAGAGYRYVGDRLANFRAVPARYPLPSYEVVDLRAGLQRNGWTLMAYAKNVGDERGEVSATIPTGVLFNVAIIQPRTYGLSLSIDF